MLQLTHAAASHIAEARRMQGLPESFGVRVSAQPNATGEVGLALAFVEFPADGDAVCEQDGTKMYVAPEVSDALSNAALNVTETPEGTALVLTEHPSDGAV
jgi:Fe-S cluster assembly iron-binding protein IscA